MAEYTASQFSKITGISRKALRVWSRKGYLIPRMEGRSVTYEDRHLTDPRVVRHMHANGKPPPATVTKLEPKVTPSKAKPRPKPRLVKKGPVTTLEALSKLRAGVVTEYFPPIEGLDENARRIWNAVFPTLIELGTFLPGEALALRDYCSTGSQIVRMDETLQEMEFTLPGGRINPLVGELNKTKTLFRSLGTTLHLTPDSRKSLKVQPKSADDGADDWARALK